MKKFRKTVTGNVYLSWSLKMNIGINMHLQSLARDFLFVMSNY